MNKLNEARKVYLRHLQDGIDMAGPEFQTLHMLLGVAIAEHDRLEKALKDICYRGRNPIAEEALGLK